jgi:hypothetical protein
LATVTPSLVIVGLPNFLSRITLRPEGPSVALTALASFPLPAEVRVELLHQTAIVLLP